MRGAEMRGAELRLPTRTASARRVRPFLRERERPVRSTAVPGGLRARVPCHAAAQRAALGLRSPRARAPCSRPLRGRRRAERARSCSPSPSGSRRRRRLCVQQRPPSTRNAPRLRNAERPLRPGASRPLQRRGVCGGGGPGPERRAAPRGGAPRAFTHVSVGPRGARGASVRAGVALRPCGCFLSRVGPRAQPFDVTSGTRGAPPWGAGPRRWPVPPSLAARRRRELAAARRVSGLGRGVRRPPFPRLQSRPARPHAPPRHPRGWSRLLTNSCASSGFGLFPRIINILHGT